jgi:hypothetical protein
MKLNLSGGGVLALAAVAAVAGLGFVLYRNRGAIVSGVADAAGAVGQAVNPTSDRNLAYRGVNAVGGAVTGDASFSLGSWLWEKLNPAAVAAERDLTGATPPAGAPIYDRWDYYARAGNAPASGDYLTPDPSSVAPYFAP